MTIARVLRSLLPALALGYSMTICAAQCEEPDGEPHVSITQHQGLLTLEARNARLVDVLGELGELSGFTTRQFATASDCAVLNASLENRTLIHIVEQLLAGTNRIIFYAPTDAANPLRTISQVWLLGSATGKDPSVESVGEARGDDDLDHDDPVRRSEAVLKLSQQVSVGMAQGEDDGALLSRVGRVLQQDLDPLVRSRAAIALGALGQEAAIDDLEAALRDENFTVRSQAINALGQIGGDRATTALGSMLLDSNIDAVERVMAAQALWRHGTETAHGYLLLGTGDDNAQVREASTRAPVTATGKPPTAQDGSRHSE